MEYKSLRSFQAYNVKAQYKVLDYGLCDVYTTDLFSMYMAYKSLWKKISNSES